MVNAFKEMGVFGKLVVICMTVSTVRACANHIADTVKMNKAAKAQ
jgi:hypothetical protein